MICSRRHFLAMACALLVPLGAEAAPDAPTLPAKFDPARDALRDLDTALQIARVTQRRVLVESAASGARGATSWIASSLRIPI